MKTFLNSFDKEEDVEDVLQSLKENWKSYKLAQRASRTGW